MLYTEKSGLGEKKACAVCRKRAWEFKKGFSGLTRPNLNLAESKALIIVIRAVKHGGGISVLWGCFLVSRKNTNHATTTNTELNETLPWFSVLRSKVLCQKKTPHPPDQKTQRALQNKVNEWEWKKREHMITSSLICSPAKTKAWLNELEMVLFTGEYETRYSQERGLCHVKITSSDSVVLKCKWDLGLELLKMQRDGKKAQITCTCSLNHLTKSWRSSVRFFICLVEILIR